MGVFKRCEYISISMRLDGWRSPPVEVPVPVMSLIAVLMQDLSISINN